MRRATSWSWLGASGGTGAGGMAVAAFQNRKEPAITADPRRNPDVIDCDGGTPRLPSVRLQPEGRKQTREWLGCIQRTSAVVTLQRIGTLKPSKVYQSASSCLSSGWLILIWRDRCDVGAKFQVERLVPLHGLAGWLGSALSAGDVRGGKTMETNGDNRANKQCTLLSCTDL